MPRTVAIEVYKFDELSDAAKEKAREWFRPLACTDRWYEFVYADAKTIATFMGFDISHIHFSGFYSQGDGAMFTGSWSARNVNYDALVAHAPMDAGLHTIGRKLAEIALKHHNATATIEHEGRYYHEHTASFYGEEFGDADSAHEYSETWHGFKANAKRLMVWIYTQLSTEYDHLMSDEAIDEAIIANEYDFREDGTHHS